LFIGKERWVDDDDDDGWAWVRCMNEKKMVWDGHGKQILKGNQKKLASLCHHSPPPAQDMVSATWFHTQGKIKGTIADLTCISSRDFCGPTNTPFSLSSSFLFCLLPTFYFHLHFLSLSLTLSPFYNTYI